MNRREREGGLWREGGKSEVGREKDEMRECVAFISSHLCKLFHVQEE